MKALLDLFKQVTQEEELGEGGESRRRAVRRMMDVGVGGGDTE